MQYLRINFFAGAAAALKKSINIHANKLLKQKGSDFRHPCVKSSSIATLYQLVHVHPAKVEATDGD